jgi:hypothetical protein
MKCSARCVELLLVGRSICVSLCAALRKSATPAVAIQLLEASCVAAPLSLAVWQHLFDWGNMNMHATRIWASVWETIPSVPKPYNLETAPPSLWLLCVLSLVQPCGTVLTNRQVLGLPRAHKPQAQHFRSRARPAAAQLADMPRSLERTRIAHAAAQGPAKLRGSVLQGC